MLFSTIQGVIDRRMLVNYRVDPCCLKPLLPSPFRPKLVRGMGIAGVCLIRLKQTRPHSVPALLGMSSENAAHRIAVEWDEDGVHREGVYIPRRDTSSPVLTWIGGTLFPGIHSHARFQVSESETEFHIQLASDDGQTHVAVEAHIASGLPTTSIFGSLEEASAFFERGRLGYSVTRRPKTLDCLELQTCAWKVEPLEVTRIESSFFQNPQRFPPGSAELDCTLLMRSIIHEWHMHRPLRSA